MRRSISFSRVSAVLIALAGTAALAGCEEPPPPPPAEVSRPAVILEISSVAGDSGLRFPGRVRAVQRAELAFNVPGQVVEFGAREGSRLAAGQLIARLDPANFETRFAAARAEFNKAQTDYERVRRIWEETQAVARAEVDQKRTALEVARSSFAAARKELEDTRLVAPFAGVIARRHVENFQNVQAKEPVVSLQNLAEVEIVIHVPERIVRAEPRRAAGYAILEGLPERPIPVTLKSFATETDPQTQTYEVVLGFTPPEGVTVLPGMPAEVLPDTDAAGPDEIAVPLAAVLGAADGTPTVWVVDPETSRVSSRPVAVGAVRGTDIVVLEGLAPGERIVVAGVHHLRDGMPVRPL
ncbi:efflux RND transporter periplasmic adaptor subunit [Wenzhouxiangella sp. XN24]|uniref:efflux RND transporter periplasmic adaptor subunit n=1 Tax=Wenzhouxiangella sp. XN24 TaxID=2713569 RepID=UPI00197D0016